jgi:ABC-2 type transport system permease protein
MVAVATAIVITGALFRTIGPRRTRFIAQILAAVVGAAFAIGVQFAAILSYGTMAMPRLAVLAGFVPGGDSVLLWPARAILGEPTALAALLGIGIAALAAAIGMFAPRFGRLALAAAGSSYSAKRHRRRPSHFHRSSAAQALRRKEWTLLLRDPWLMSQTLMQLLYLLPAAFLLWRNFYGGGDVSALLVPILIVTAGQLGGGLAWLAVSGEDAPDLIASAPVPTAHVLRAKTEAVLGGIAVVLGPFVVMLASPHPFPRLSRSSASSSRRVRPRQFSIGSVPRRGAAFSGGARPRRALPPSPRRCHRPVGPAQERLRRREPGSRLFPALSCLRSSPAPGWSAQPGVSGDDRWVHALAPGSHGPSACSVV